MFGVNLDFIARPGVGREDMQTHAACAARRHGGLGRDHERPPDAAALRVGSHRDHLQVCARGVAQQLAPKPRERESEHLVSRLHGHQHDRPGLGSVEPCPQHLLVAAPQIFGVAPPRHLEGRQAR